MTPSAPFPDGPQTSPDTQAPQPTVIVTGGAGFIGSSVVRMLVRAGEARVVNVDALTYAGNLDSLEPVAGEPSYYFEHIDIRDADSLRRIFDSYHPTQVIHLAAESHVDRSIDAPFNFIQTNIVGTYVLLSEAHRYWTSLPPDESATFRFLHVSTDEVYGSLGAEGKFTEGSAYDPSSPYAASKASSDHLVRSWNRTFGLPAMVTNCSNNYGPYQFPEKLIPLMILNALEGKPLPVYGRGENIRDWLFVDDHAAALLQVLAHGKPGETYLIGGENEMRNIEVVEWICDLMDELSPMDGGLSHRSLIEFVPDRPGHDMRYAIDPTRIEAELGWRPRHDFRSGLRATVEWYIENRSWWERVRSGIYRGERLGLGAQT